MSFATRVIMMVGLVACLVSVAHALPGQATIYTSPYVPSACYGFQDRGVMIAAANDVAYANGRVCGRRYRIRCTSGTNQGVPQPCRGNEVIVTIVDRCPGCNSDDQLELSQEAFSIIADPNAGRINMNYTRVW